MVGPTVEKLASAYEGKAVVGKINVDEEMALAEKFKVMSIPTLFVMKGGQVVDRVIGARPYEDLAAMIDKAL
jgi:thioredoxin 1